MLKNIFSAILGTTALTLAAPTTTQAETNGRLEVAPSYLRVDVLRNENTVKTLNLPAVKADGTYNIYNGFCIKGSVLGGTNEGNLVSTGLGLGQIIPLSETITITPHAGGTYTYMSTTLENTFDYRGPIDYNETFHAVAPYVAVDLAVKFTKSLRAYANASYAWSRSHTTLSVPGRDAVEAAEGQETVTAIDPMSILAKGNSEGFTVGGMFEYDITESFSANFGAAYNTSMDKGNNGLRGYGMKFGFGYWL